MSEINAQVLILQALLEDSVVSSTHRIHNSKRPSSYYSSDNLACIPVSSISDADKIDEHVIQSYTEYSIHYRKLKPSLQLTYLFLQGMFEAAQHNMIEVNAGGEVTFRVTANANTETGITDMLLRVNDSMFYVYKISGDFYLKTDEKADKLMAYIDEFTGSQSLTISGHKDYSYTEMFANTLCAVCGNGGEYRLSDLTHALPEMVLKLDDSGKTMTAKVADPAFSLEWKIIDNDNKLIQAMVCKSFTESAIAHKKGAEFAKSVFSDLVDIWNNQSVQAKTYLTHAAKIFKFPDRTITIMLPNELKRVVLIVTTASGTVWLTAGIKPEDCACLADNDQIELLIDSISKLLPRASLKHKVIKALPTLRKTNTKTDIVNEDIRLVIDMLTYGMDERAINDLQSNVNSYLESKKSK